MALGNATVLLYEHDHQTPVLGPEGRRTGEMKQGKDRHVLDLGDFEDAWEEADGSVSLRVDRSRDGAGGPHSQARGAVLNYTGEHADKLRKALGDKLRKAK